MRVFTDASGSGIAGISFVLTDNNNNIILKKAKPVLNVDNNTAELMAILYALEEIQPTREPITVITDSTYAINCIRNNSCRSNERATLDLINYHLETKNCSTLWIKGHSDDGTMFSAFNRLADNLSRKARKDYIDVRKSMKVRLVKRQKRRNRWRGRDKQW
ncbi:MAG: reverse transcriptase-like protein [Methanobrevibacter sp.]|nr:reverse transcriptase-like protein [Methanobrevibacter sp.]